MTRGYVGDDDFSHRMAAYRQELVHTHRPGRPRLRRSRQRPTYGRHVRRMVVVAVLLAVVVLAGREAPHLADWFQHYVSPVAQG